MTNPKEGGPAARLSPYYYLKGYLAMTFFGQIARPGGYRGLEKCSIGCLIHKVRKIVLVMDDARHEVLVRQVLPVRQLRVRCEYYDDGEQCGDDGILVHDLSFCKNERTKPFIGLVGAKLAIISRLSCVSLHLFINI